ncbi:MAG: right-handed parallel beta-helix repeat-containing protein [bacterium]
MLRDPFRVVVVGIIMTVVGTSGVMAEDYTTPGTGTTLTLAQIAALPARITVTGGPTSFTLNGSIIVSPNDTLSITSGESLRAADDPSGAGYALVMKGRLQALGSVDNPVRLGSQKGEPGSWRGIVIQPEATAQSTVRHCEISDAQIGVLVRGTSNAVVEDDTFTSCKVAAVYVAPGAKATIRRNTIVNWEEGVGVLLVASQGSEVSSNTVRGGGVGVGTEGSDSTTILSDNETSVAVGGFVSVTTDRSTVESNLVHGGELGAVVAENSTTAWTNNTIEGQQMAGMAVVNSAVPKLRGNTFRQSVSLGGMFIDDNAAPNLGFTGDPGNNVFADNVNWDLINFTAASQRAVGNTWSAAPPDISIYDDEDDVGDLDNNGVLSGPVYLTTTGMDAWIFY